MAIYSSNKNCRSKSHSSTVGNWKYINYAKLINPKATRTCCKVFFLKTFWLRMISVQWLIEPMFNAIMDVLIASLRRRLKSWAHFRSFNIQLSFPLWNCLQGWSSKVFQGGGGGGGWESSRVFLYNSLGGGNRAFKWIDFLTTRAPKARTP
jgi:hypothetical protein